MVNFRMVQHLSCRSKKSVIFFTSVFLLVGLLSCGMKAGVTSESLEHWERHLPPSLQHFLVTQETLPVAETDTKLLDIKSMYAIHELELYLYTAYIDDRSVTSVIRIFGIRRNSQTAVRFWCAWRDGGRSDILWRVRAQVEFVYDEWPAQNKYLAIMMTCRVPMGSNTYSAKYVNVFSHWLKTSVNVPIRTSKALYRQRELMAVCVKPITGQFTASRVVEWFEIQRESGISRFIIYNTDLFGASRFVLEYYQSLGLLETVSFPFLTAVLEATESNEKLNDVLRFALYQQIYIVALQDCLYRFRRSYENLIVIDIDEVILPAKNESMTSMVTRAQQVAPPASASYCFVTSWHYKEFTNISLGSADTLYMQMYAWAPPPTMHQPKSIIVTDKALTINYHVVLKSLTNVEMYELPWQQFGYVHHFRNGQCAPKFGPQHCKLWIEQVREDDVIRRYKNSSYIRTSKVLKYLEIN